MDASAPDLLRLIAVPALGWAAWRDVRTRRVTNRLWPPLVALGVLVLAWDASQLLGTPTGPLFTIQVVLSLGLIVPLALGFWMFGAFGGADAKALMTLAVLFPTYPTYAFVGGSIPGLGATAVLTLPLYQPMAGLFALTILGNTVIAGLAYPVALAVRNALAGRVSWVMVVGRPVAVPDIPTTHGRLLETPAGFSRAGCDIDAVRMYLDWRETDLATLRADPDRARRPASVPDQPADPGDGSVRTDGGTPDAGDATDGAASPPTPPRGDPSATDEPLDPWGAQTFLTDAGGAYGTTPEQLRGALDVLTEADRETVWVSPGIPFLVPMVAGLVVSLTAGDLLVWGMDAVGLI
ncbi:peptidase A24 [Halococcoides cellulosivorans]|uniref:Peptidase A24 n=1 Tax=Halococcoides cellulosivorans TaxID=1679096 RepID=A0A2R4X4X3_9EURY|nr:A24 family peptidase [Halococcoides cellulosivorans]AWB28743.1 peptidase A24 [Halococcoides cellulosivorans]